MKQVLSIFVLLMMAIALILNQALPADAAKGSAKKKGIAQEELDEIITATDDLTKKIYERELYTPEDTKTLAGLKIKLDSRMDILPETSFAPIYFKLGEIFRKRGEESDAITCYKTILENFYDTAYGPKSREILTQMGVEINLPDEASQEEDDF